MKKNNVFVLGILAMVLVFGFVLSGCATGTGGGNDNGGESTIYYNLFWNEEDGELNITFWGASNSKKPLTDTQKAGVNALSPSDITIQNNGGGNLAPSGDTLYQNSRTDLFGKKLPTTGSKTGTNNKITIAAKNGFIFAEQQDNNTF